MKVVTAALEAYANRYAQLGIRLNEAQAKAIVESIVRDENPPAKPSKNEVEQLARHFVRRVDSDIANQSI